MAFSAACVETVVVNGREYGAALLGECSQSSGRLSKVNLDYFGFRPKPSTLNPGLLSKVNVNTSLG